MGMEANKKKSEFVLFLFHRNTTTNYTTNYREWVYETLGNFHLTSFFLFVFCFFVFSVCPTRSTQQPQPTQMKKKIKSKILQMGNRSKYISTASQRIQGADCRWAWQHFPSSFVLFFCFNFIFCRCCVWLFDVAHVTGLIGWTCHCDWRQMTLSAAAKDIDERYVVVGIKTKKKKKKKKIKKERR